MKGRISINTMKFLKKTLMLLLCMLILSGGFSNFRMVGIVSATASSTVTFNATETNVGVWDDGIAEDGDGGSVNIPNLTLQAYNISDINGILIPKTLVHGVSA